MPGKKSSYRRKRSTRGKRSNRRRRSTRRRSGPDNSIRSYAGFPVKMTTHLRYNDTIALANMDGGAIAYASYRANGIFDPQVAVGGHQPMGYDQWSAVYNHYVVKGSKISCKFMTAGNSARPMTVGLTLDDDATPTNLAVYTMMERGNSRRRTFIDSYLSGQSQQTLRHFFSPRKFFDIKDIKDNRNDLGALVGADPTEQAYYLLWAGSADVTYDPATSVYCELTIDYIVEWSEPKDINSS